MPSNPERSDDLPTRSLRSRRARRRGTRSLRCRDRSSVGQHFAVDLAHRTDAHFAADGEIEDIRKLRTRGSPDDRVAKIRVSVDAPEPLAREPRRPRAREGTPTGWSPRIRARTEGQPRTLL